MSWSPSDVTAQAERDFEAAWMDTIGLAPGGGFKPKREGRPHPCAELLQGLRLGFIKSGYSEMFLPLFVEEAELSQQLGPEAPLALGDSFLASVYPRHSPPPAGALPAIQRIAPTFSAERLEKIRSIMGDYVSEEFGSDELLSRVVEEAGVRMEAQRVQAKGPQPLEGLTFVITGTLPSMSREDATRLIEEYGGRVTGSVSANTDYLLIGEKPGSSKYNRAQQLGVPTLEEGELRAMIAGGGGDGAGDDNPRQARLEM